MRIACLALVIASTTLPGCERTEAKLYPTHIESPDYDRTAQLAHIEGEVDVVATIDSAGNVIDAKAKGPPMLASHAVKNILQWKFERPRHAPSEQTVVYDFRLEEPGECDFLPAKVSFDLPGRVDIVAQGVHTCDPATAVSQIKNR